MNVDYCRHYAPERVPLLFREALGHMASPGEPGVLELAERLGISRSYAYQLLAGDAKNVSYGIQVMLERLLAPGGLDVIDAARHYDPGQAPDLVSKARGAWVTQQRVADKMGISRDYLRKLAVGRRYTYGVQVMLEVLIECRRRN